MISRRHLLRGAAACALLPTLAPGRAAAAGDPFMKLDATAQAALVSSGEASAAELVAASVSRIEALNPALNAVVTTSYEQALAVATSGPPAGPFQGVPYLIKDLVDQAGVRTTRGSKLFANAIAEAHSPSVKAQLGLGLISLGKSNTPEFGFLPTTESVLLGPCRNPWNPEHTAGGSSGGAAAAVASGMTPIASASDGGGSIRIPASCCGLFGLKTSRGRTIANAPPAFAQISVQNIVSRSVRDSATALVGIQAQSDLPVTPLVTGPSDRKLRIALSTRSMLGTAPDPEVAAAIEATAALCESLGHTVEEAQPDFDGPLFADAFLTVWANGAKGLVETATRLSGQDPRDSGLLEPFTLGLADWFDAKPEGHLAASQAVFAQVTQAYATFHERFDVALTPVLGAPPPKIGAMAPTIPFETLEPLLLDYVGYTPMANATGAPAMSVPLTWSAAGLPIGS
ncbi:MAG: amidase family protein, partial [Pseudomonadota bacterium]